MTELDPTLIFVVCACLGLFLSGVRARRRAHRLNLRVLEQARRIELLESDLSALLSCSRNIGDRIGDVERTDRTLQKQLDQLSYNRDDGQVAIEHAMKLLASGQDMKEVTRICELSEGEVEILQNLSRYRSAA